MDEDDDVEAGENWMGRRSMSWRRACSISAGSCSIIAVPFGTVQFLVGNTLSMNLVSPFRKAIE
ncbi:hypothetical protein [Pasteuria penetrans]|uniref:hypothetical protein n=1 Tax=Pasteuria penetrans TaxID=86005 RepID=UPI000FBD952C|nr:hypothetical protein [Pasteuria penetrans]